MPQVEMNPEANKDAELIKTAASNTKKWAIATYKVLLSVVHVTLISIIVALADAAFIAVVSSLFGNPAAQPLLAQYIFSVLKVLSIFGTTVLYIIYLAYSLFGEARRVIKLLKEEEN